MSAGDGTGAAGVEEGATEGDAVSLDGAGGVCTEAGAEGVAVTADVDGWDETVGVSTGVEGGDVWGGVGAA